VIGQTISHYKILEKLGEGGMGVVYKAEDTKLKRTVALKFLSPHAPGTDDEKARFKHEAQAAAALYHPKNCTLYEIDETEGQPFIAMEYIEGRSLKDLIEAGPLKPENALETTTQIVDGLREAHRRRIVHRDIKPANIMITDEGRAKVMDFGLAKSLGRTQLTRDGTTVGTVAYMSPEQARGVEIDHRTDIWSSGVILYEMIFRQPPFKGRDKFPGLFV
jgi:serine/threonine protein kinase